MTINTRDIEVQQYINKMLNTELTADQARILRWSSMSLDLYPQDWYEVSGQLDGGVVPEQNIKHIEQIKNVLDEHDLYYCVISDPDNVTLHISDEPIDQDNYDNRGIAIKQ